MADKVVAEGQLGMPRFLVADDERVAGDELARAEGTDNPPVGLRAGAHEDAGVGHVVATGHLAPGGHEVHALAGARDPSRGAGAAAEVGLVEGHGAPGRGVGARHRVVVELALCREEHALPPLGAEPAAMEVEVVEHEELFVTALREVQALGPRRTADYGNGRLYGVDVLVSDGRVEV